MRRRRRGGEGTIAAARWWTVVRLAQLDRVEPEPTASAFAAARDLVALRESAPPVAFRGSTRQLVRGAAMIDAAGAAGIHRILAVDLDKLDGPAAAAVIGAWDSLSAGLGDSARAAAALDDLERAAVRAADRYVDELRARTRDPLIRSALNPSRRKRGG